MFARTARLTLRPGWPEDAPALAAAIAHRPVVANLSGPPWPYGVADARHFLAGRGADDHFCLILAHEAPTPTLIGGIGLSPLTRTVPGTSHDLGYWLTPAAWGRGYATEAGRAVLGMARHALGLKRLGSSHFVDNPASARVLAKLGFRPTGDRRSVPCAARGGEVEAVLMALDLDADSALPLAA